jgi:hypothetical protein
LMTGYRATQLQRTIPLPILQMKADVLCQSGPGDRTPAWLVIPKSLVGRAPAMVCRSWNQRRTRPNGRRGSRLSTVYARTCRTRLRDSCFGLYASWR